MIWSTSHPEAVADVWMVDGWCGREGWKCSAPDCEESEDRPQPRLNCCPDFARGPTEHTVVLSTILQYYSRRPTHYNVNMIGMKEDILGVVTVYARL